MHKPLPTKHFARIGTCIIGVWGMREVLAEIAETADSGDCLTQIKWISKIFRSVCEGMRRFSQKSQKQLRKIINLNNQINLCETQTRHLRGTPLHSNCIAGNINCVSGYSPCIGGAVAHPPARLITPPSRQFRKLMQHNCKIVQMFFEFYTLTLHQKQKLIKLTKT